MPRRKGTVLSEEAKERGRVNRAVSAYLEYLAGGTSSAPVRDTDEQRRKAALAKLDEQLATPGLSAARRLVLLQRRRDLEAGVLPPGRGRRTKRPAELEAGFIAHAARYAQLHGIDPETFLAFGVPAEVLAQAGLHPKPDHN